MKRVFEPRHNARWSHDPWDDADITDAIMLERPRRSGRRLRWFVWAAGIVGMVGIIVAGMVGLWYARQVNPPGEAGAYEQFTVLPTDTVETLSQRLQEEGIITSAGVFRYYVDDRGGLELTPGDYQIRPMDSMGDLLETFRTPPELTYTNVTFPEGYTLARMSQRLQDEVPRLAADDFLTAASDGVLRSPYQPDGVTSLEGLLFPDTYQVSNGESAYRVVERMLGLMERVGRQENIEAGAAALGQSEYNVLIIASMIEREAKLDEDRAKIARVIYNRLYLGMPLQIDATLYYGQDSEANFGDLKALDTPYNTYLYAGLPPTPIANPGRASIRAALNPAPNPAQGDPLCVDLPDDVPCLYLFYVLANDDGGHAFAATLEQHEANIRAADAAGVGG
jgi:UPF0755 protein